MLSLLKKLTNRSSVEMLSLTESKQWLSLRYEESISQHNLGEEAKAYIKSLLEQRMHLESMLDSWGSRKDLTPAQYDEFHILFSATRKVLEQFPQKFSSLEQALAIHALLQEKCKELQQQLGENSFLDNFSLVLPQGLAAGMNPLQEKLFVVGDIQKIFGQKIAESKVILIEKLRHKIEVLQDIAEQDQQRQNDLHLKEERLHYAQQKMDEKEVELHRLKEDTNYSSVMSLSKKREQVLSQLEENSDLVFVFFSKLKRAFEQYLLVIYDDEFRNVIERYCNDVSALFKDEGIVILHALQHLKSMLLAEKLNLTIEQRNTVLKQIEKGCSGYVLQLQKKQLSLRQELEAAEAVLIHRSLFIKLKDAHYRLEHFREQISRLAGETVQLRQQQKGLLDMKERERVLFERMIKAGLGRNVCLQG